LLKNIPDGYLLCDGTNDTPDLRNKFIRGAFPMKPPGSTGGEAIHTHPFTGDGHLHEADIGDHIFEEIGFRYSSTNVAVSGTTDSKSTLAPYYSLAYLQKV